MPTSWNFNWKAYNMGMLLYPKFLFYIYFFFLFQRLYYSLQGDDTSRYEETKTFGILWLVLYLYVTRVWGTVRFLMAAYRYNNSEQFEYKDVSLYNTVDKIFVYMQSLGDSLQAFVNFIVLYIAYRNKAVLLPCIERKSRSTSINAELGEQRRLLKKWWTMKY